LGTTVKGRNGNSPVTTIGGTGNTWGCCVGKGEGKRDLKRASVALRAHQDNWRDGVLFRSVAVRALCTKQRKKEAPEKTREQQKTPPQHSTRSKPRAGANEKKSRKAGVTEKENRIGKASTWVPSDLRY